MTEKLKVFYAFSNHEVYQRKLYDGLVEKFNERKDVEIIQDHHRH